MPKHHDVKYLGDILDYGREARALVAGVSIEDFLANRVLQLALAHLIQIIGEAAFKLPVATREQAPEVPWADIIGMRHRLVHDYGMVSYRFLWEAATEDLEPLIRAVETILTPPGPPSA
jgi:uncharacterized protein with HEPN domain